MNGLRRPWIPAGRLRQPVLLGAGICLLACCLLAGCAPAITGTVTGRNSTSTATSTPHTDSDPGDRKLNLLATDPALVNLPAGMVRTSVQQTPAHYETCGLGSGGSWGDGVTVTFASTASQADVYKAIAENAARNGWVAKGSNSAGMTNRWLKTYPDGTPATLFLSRDAQRRHLRSILPAPSSGPWSARSQAGYKGKVLAVMGPMP